MVRRPRKARPRGLESSSRRFEREAVPPSRPGPTPAAVPYRGLAPRPAVGAAPAQLHACTPSRPCVRPPGCGSTPRLVVVAALAPTKTSQARVGPPSPSLALSWGWDQLLPSPWSLLHGPWALYPTPGPLQAPSRPSSASPRPLPGGSLIPWIPLQVPSLTP